MGSYILSFIEGFLTFISPCILPLLPVYLSYLTGAPEHAGKKALINNRLLYSIGFVLGFSLVFVALGAAASALGGFLKGHIGFFREVSGLIMIAFGLNFAGVLKLGFLDFEKRVHFNADRIDFLKAVLFGAVFGFGWSPCAGAFLGSALLLAGSSETITRGIALLLVYSLGLGVPFILTAVLFGRLESTFGFIRRHGRIISTISGIVLIIAGLLVFTDKMKYLGTITW